MSNRGYIATFITPIFANKEGTELTTCEQYVSFLAKNKEEAMRIAKMFVSRARVLKGVKVVPQGKLNGNLMSMLSFYEEALYN